jgi:hypothetical protein
MPAAFRLQFAQEVISADHGAQHLLAHPLVVRCPPHPSESLRGSTHGSSSGSTLPADILWLFSA